MQFKAKIDAKANATEWEIKIERFKKKKMCNNQTTHKIDKTAIGFHRFD